MPNLKGKKDKADKVSHFVKPGISNPGTQVNHGMQRGFIRHMES